MGAKEKINSMIKYDLLNKVQAAVSKSVRSKKSRRTKRCFITCVRRKHTSTEREKRKNMSTV